LLTVNNWGQLFYFVETTAESHQEFAMIVRLMLVVACLLTFASAHAQDSPLISTGQLELNQAGAELILKHSQQQAQKMELKVNIAVVDRGGHLMAFIRMDGARAGSGY